MMAGGCIESELALIVALPRTLYPTTFSFEDEADVVFIRAVTIDKSIRSC